MENSNKTYFMPIIVILAGAFFQLQAMGLLGTSSGALMEIAWPAIFIAAGLDLFFGAKRILGAAVLVFSGLAVLIFNITAGSSETWNVFINFWPLLLMLFGIDMLLCGRSLAGSLLVIIIIAILVYAILGAKGIVPIPDVPLPTSSGMAKSYPLTTPGPGGVSSGSRSRQIDYLLPQQANITLRFGVNSGKLQLKSENLDNRSLTGSIALASNETFSEEMLQDEYSVTYALSSTAANENKDSDAFWNLKVSQRKNVALSLKMNNGYQIIDFRGMSLASADIMNNTGNIDIMLPYSSQIPINLQSANGTIRIFIPEGTAVYCTYSGENTTVTYPENYMQSGNEIYPMEMTGPVVPVNIRLSNGTIKLVTARN